MWRAPNKHPQMAKTNQKQHEINELLSVIKVIQSSDLRDDDKLTRFTSRALTQFVPQHLWPFLEHKLFNVQLKAMCRSWIVMVNWMHVERHSRASIYDAFRASEQWLISLVRISEITGEMQLINFNKLRRAREIRVRFRSLLAFCSAPREIHCKKQKK